ncbi:MAG: prepilin-type N-terminal cleavage/methylation domain-containing protein [Tissierellia bacterium]|nr:prepilin-type N-terminal cleavage/methylation domain-containing protein [Tissierellia bacterium]
MKRNRKAFTLLEIILSIAILALIAAAFLPALTQGVNAIVHGKKFTVDSSRTQKEVEKNLADFYLIKSSGDSTLYDDFIADNNFTRTLLSDSSGNSSINVFDKYIDGYFKKYDIFRRIKVGQKLITVYYLYSYQM